MKKKLLNSSKVNEIHKKTICLFTYEFFPFTTGGCGTYIKYVTELLSEKFNVIILIYNSKEIVKNIDKLYEKNKNILVFGVTDIVKPSLNFLNLYKQRSWEFYKAFEIISKLIKIDIVEFFEYVGIGYFTLKNREYLPRNIKYLVRIHGSMKIIDFYEKRGRLNINNKVMHGMEKFTIYNSDVRIFPLARIINDYESFYRFNLSNKTNIILPPPTHYIVRKKLKKIKKKENILFFSNLKRIKSPETFIRSSVEFLRNNNHFTGKFIIAGANSQYNNRETYWDYLNGLIPEQYKLFFQYIGQINHLELSKVLNDTKFAVITSKWESFSFVFYEIISSKTPVFCRNISAFSFIGNKKFLFNNEKELVQKMASFNNSCDQSKLLTLINKLNNKDRYINIYLKI